MSYSVAIAIPPLPENDIEAWAWFNGVREAEPAHCFRVQRLNEIPSAKPLAFSLEFGEIDPVKPVSYTHLTLPTILRV